MTIRKVRLGAVYRRARRLAGRGRNLLNGLRHRLARRLAPPGRGATLAIPRRRPSLEIHVPISPTSTFINMVRCLAQSLRLHGGAYRDAPVIVTAADCAVDPSLAERLGWLPGSGVELRWADPADFARLGIRAQGRQRLMYEHQADMVLLLDADILIARPFDDMIEAVFAEQVIAGLIAHVSPFEQARLDHVDWDALWRHCGLGRPRLAFEHTGWGYMSADPRHRWCPAYFNYGVLAAPRSFVRRLAGVIDESLARVREVAECVFDAQLALAVAIDRLGLPARALPMRYNFANVPLVEALHAAEVPHACILHLLGQHQINKVEVFASLESLQAFVDVPHPRVINAAAQRIIREVLPLMRAENHRAGLMSGAV